MRFVAVVAAVSACSAPARLALDAGHETDASSDAGPPAECQHAGELDPTFGVGGRTGIFDRGTHALGAVVIAPDQRILLGGSLGPAIAAQSKLAIVRLLDDGSRDPSFGENGVALAGVANHDCWLEDIELQTDGAIVGTGGCNSLPEGENSPAAFVVARFQPTGELDPSFGVGGIVLGQPALRGHGVAVAIDPQGRIVIAGQFYGTDDVDQDFVTARFMPDGSLDESFASGGVATRPFGTDRDLANDLALQADGRILVTGPTGAAAWSFGIVRYNEDGSLDDTYGSGGHVTIGDGVGAIATGIALDGSGRSIIVGPYNGASGVARLQTDGVLDASFATDGILLTAAAGARKVAIAPQDQTILVTGNHSTSSADLMRLTPDGALDTTFGTDGVSSVASSASATLASAVAIDGRGRIVVGATAVNDSSAVLAQDFFVARFCP